MKPTFLLIVAVFAAGFRSRAAEPVQVSPADPSSVWRAIDQAAGRGAKKVVIPAGTYRFGNTAETGQTMVFSRLRDLEIDATGAMFVFTDLTRGSILFDHCEKVTLKGVALLNDPIPFSQGTIVRIAEDRQSFEVQVAGGYPEYLDQKHYIMDVFDPASRHWKPGTHDIFGDRAEQVGPGRFRIRKPVEGMAVVVGDLVAWRGPSCPDIQLSGCAGMRIDDVVIRSAKGFAVLEEGGAGGNHYHYQVTYGPAPAGAQEAPLMACNADAFHSSGVRRGPTLEGCRFEGMGDDGVPIHGSYAAVVEAHGTSVVIAARKDEWCQAGDRLQRHDRAQIAHGEATVVEVHGVPAPAVPVVFPIELRLFRETENLRYFALTLDRAVEAAPGDLVGNTSACGGDFVVRDCTIRDHRARGMLIKSGPGLIERCLVEGSTMGGIVIAPEPEFWNEAGYAHDLVVRDNTIRRTGGWTQPGLDMAGALSIGAHERGRFVPLPGGHRNILVERNRFENNDGVNVLLSSAIGVTLRGNVFAHAMEAPSDRGSACGVNTDSLIWLTESRDVVLEDNVIESAGAFLKRPVQATDSATGTGFADGVRPK